jgi:hypothetical protein
MTFLDSGVERKGKALLVDCERVLTDWGPVHAGASLSPPLTGARSVMSNSIVS